MIIVWVSYSLSQSGEDELFESLVPIVEKGRETKNFENGRFMDRILQDMLFTHAIRVKGTEINDKYFILNSLDIPGKLKIHK